MSIKEYKIVDATQLDTDLASIANALKTKLGSSGNLTFPEDFVTAINQLQYDANPNTANDISFSNGEVIVEAGIFNNQTMKAIPNNYVDVTDITQTTDDNNIIAPMVGTESFTIPAGYYPEDLEVEFLA